MGYGKTGTGLRAVLAIVGGLAAFAGSAAEAAIIVSWTGTVSVFNYGAYGGGEAVSSSFVLDESVAATGASIKTFPFAADGMTMTIGGDAYSGEDGRLQQYSTVTDFFVVNFITGVLGGESFNGYALTDYVFELRGTAGDLFSDPATMAAGLTEADINYSNIGLRFDDPLTATDENLYARVFLSTLSISGTPTAVPAPATLGLLGAGLAGLSGFLRRRKRAGRSAPAYPR